MHGVFLRLVLAVLLLVAAVAHAHHAAPQAVLRDANASGVIATASTGGVIDPANPFFQSAGRNGRACVSCHDPAEGWTITPAGARARFETSEGLDPLFRTNDGSVSPRADASTDEARRSAHRLLLERGLIRLRRSIPAATPERALPAPPSHCSRRGRAPADVSRRVARPLHAARPSSTIVRSARAACPAARVTTRPMPAATRAACSSASA